MRHGAVELIYAPVIRLVEFKLAEVIPAQRLRYPLHGVGHGLRIVAKVHRVRLGAATGRPRESHVCVYESLPVARDRIIGLTGENEEAPEPAFMFGHTVGFHFINAPVICRTRNETVRIWESGKTDNKKCRGLIALERALGSSTHVIKIVAQIDIM